MARLTVGALASLLVLAGVASAQFGAGGPVIEVRSPDGRLKARGHGTAIRLIDTRSGRLIRTLTQGIRSPVTALAFSPDGRMLAYAEAAPAVGMFEVRTHRLRWRTTAAPAKARLLSFTNAGTVLLARGAGRDFKRYDASTGRLLRPTERLDTEARERVKLPH